MKMYKIKDIFDLANSTYNLKLDPKNPDDKKEIETIKRAIRRALKQENPNLKSYKVNEEQAYHIINATLNAYFLKKSAQKHPFLQSDHDRFIQMQQQHTPDNLSYQQAVINVKLDMIMRLLEKLLYDGKQNYFFKEPAFKKAFNEYKKHVSADGYPMPGYTESRNQLDAAEDFFQLF